MLAEACPCPRRLGAAPACGLACRPLCLHPFQGATVEGTVCADFPPVHALLEAGGLCPRLHISSGQLVNPPTHCNVGRSNLLHSIGPGACSTRLAIPKRRLASVATKCKLPVRSTLSKFVSEHCTNHVVSRTELPMWWTGFHPSQRLALYRRWDLARQPRYYDKFLTAFSWWAISLP